MKTIRTESEQELISVLETYFEKGDIISLQISYKRSDIHEGRFLAIKWDEEKEEGKVYLQVSPTKGAFVYTDEILAIENHTAEVYVDNEESVKLSILIYNLLNAILGLMGAVAIYVLIMWMLK